ncbi:unnamed protein product, partial [Rotaria sp. Silwood1]
MPSKSIFVKTLPDRPKIPTDNEVTNNIAPQENHPQSTSTQFVININPLLFSPDNGIIEKYLIYVRQDQSNTMPEIILNGTYVEAWNNASFDYLAVEIPISSSSKNLVTNDSNISVLLGNQTICLNTSVKSTPCNGPLKPSTTYKLIVSGCTVAGCTSVLSKQFITQSKSYLRFCLLMPIKIDHIKEIAAPPDKSGSSKAWVVIFPLLVLAIAAGLAVWKREPLKQMIKNNIKKDKKSLEDVRKSSISLSAIYTAPMKKPKPLSQYINMTNEDEKAIFAEYQELDSTSPQYRLSEYEPEHEGLDRYSNILARGPWERTAVRLSGSHRIYDYINANEIKGFNSNKQYIACQGPLENTCEDFWDMIIQYDVKKIVMLTRTEERNPHNPSQTLSKCYRYFPDNKGQLIKFNRISVQVIDVEFERNVDLEIRYLLIKADNNEYRVFH